MKYTLYLLLLVLGSSLSSGQSPEPVYSFALATKSPKWYKSQINAWKAEIDKDNSNGLAWYYYYYATRNLQMTDTNDRRHDTLKAQERLNLVEQMGKAIPNSYEFHLCTWKEHGNDPNYKKHLDKVYELGPNRIEHIDFIINDGEFERNKDKRNQALIKKWEAGLLSPGMANYNRNVLAGLPEKAILLTVGDNDTYPAWYVQAMGFRKDVYVLNISLLSIEDYRNKVLKELGVEKMDLDWSAKSEDDANHRVQFYKNIIPKLSKNTKGYEVYVGLSSMGAKHLVGEHEDKLYLTGLTYKYCEETVDERALLKRNFEHRYALDYIRQTYYHDISSALVKQINQNYILPMFKLYEHYTLSGDITRKEWLKQLILDVSSGTNSETEVKKLLD